ncbi:MAG: molybdate ABC transporter substrate-binding protein [Alphaproteobacteria bacterium]
MIGLLHRLSVFAAVLVASFLGGFAADAGDVRVAVAANFAGALEEIAGRFSSETGNDVLISIGSTGLLYTQITQGAPFDVFLAADQARPERLVDEGYADPSSRFTYAVGRLVLYSAKPGLFDDIGILEAGDIDRLAMANPKTAPYGKAAEETLKAYGLFDAFAGRIVQGANIGQTYQYVATGNVDLGFVALSQVARHREGSRWIVPSDKHGVLAQDAVLLETGKENPAALDFLTYLRAPESVLLIESWGYEAPAGS